MRLDNQAIYKKYQSIMVNEAKTGTRKKVQQLEDQIDNFMDSLEKEVDKEKDNPTFQRKMYQMLANTTKEYNEFLAILKQVCQVIDSGAKVLPAELPAVGEKMEAADATQDEMQKEEEEGAAPAEEDGGDDEFELKVAKKGKGKKKKESK